MIVIAPCDYNETYKAVTEAVSIDNPVYLRFYRDKTPNFTNPDEKFVIGKANILADGDDVTLVASGLLVWEALKAANVLEKEGIKCRVVNFHTIKPIDEELISKCAKETGLIITCEDHQKYGGLYSAVAEIVVKNYPVKMDYIAVNDTFGESGTMEQLMSKYKINSEEIIKKVKLNLKIK
jgi:transketolase